ncbi:MAG: ketol-acid reductoisomerase, partial [Gaiellales bacterium]
LKLIVDLIYEGGLSYMRYSISDTAEFGDYSRGPVVIDENVRKNMRKVLKSIQDGRFAEEWISEMDEGESNLKRQRKIESEMRIEQVGRELRALMQKV